MGEMVNASSKTIPVMGRTEDKDSLTFDCNFFRNECPPFVIKARQDALLFYFQAEKGYPYYEHTMIKSN
jgi:hypothetical protein